MAFFNKILIANRGEIALRIGRTAHLMGISSVVVYSDADADALFVNVAEEAVALGGNTPTETYLNIDKIIAVAKRTGADAIHPGYGFLSENPAFARRCAAEKITFIGPSAEAMEALGSKSAAKRLMQKHNVPLIKGYNETDQSPERLLYEASEIGYPLLVKASAGGGGKGMRIVQQHTDLPTAIAAAKREALAAFGDDTLILERYVESAKHIEVQVISDSYGNVLHFFDRECSTQRRFQKIIEEAPSPSINNKTRRELCAAGVRAIKAVKYLGVATVEFIYDEKAEEFYFLEVNTRLQVEHPVTEEVTGADLVRLQIEVAQGARLGFEQEDIELMGHAIEARIYAEDPSHDFRPATGTVHLWSESRIPDIRFESGVETGSVISTFYDPMIAKVIAHSPTRHEAIMRLSKALGELCILGVTTNRSFLITLLNNPDFAEFKIDTRYIDQNLHELAILSSTDEEDIKQYCMAATLWRTEQRKTETPSYLRSIPSGFRNNVNAPQIERFVVAEEWYTVSYRIHKKIISATVNDMDFGVVQIRESGENHITLVINGLKITFDIAADNYNYYIQRTDFPTELLQLQPRFPVRTPESVVGNYNAPMPGEIVKVCVEVGDTVAVGDALIVLSSMKMENIVYADTGGTVQAVFVIEKQLVQNGVPLLIIV